ncbi:SusC/RagA family TonB-linked outer membrane protein [Pedobacter psychrodurus]|uniref:SusC/RagA family TonB-linked outer membrane protein n=1 Tax=Pedobacter psychrodurus TaxID=2530456 RepID=A0A4R0Q871_9SPHI|nr:SusC/RagA family TonB-linked outer membrane protein [Pedobacter psychrodurus]TCD29646.1 SusC/RagA family TonB-linked outer membrane protein [Pedobacter psychrodurus]
MKKLLQSLFVLLFFAFNAIAQERTITGTVTSAEDNIPLPGVSVRAIGSQAVAVTGADGKYSLRIGSAVTAIQFSYIGFTSKTVNVPSSNTLNVGLASDSKSLADVVVVAYGTQKKESITGSVSTINSKDLESRTVTNVTAALQGSAPGISVGASNGQPGSSAGIRIRGFGSFSASNTPLYVLDGSVYDGSIGDINQNDIESISVLKDASSSALYGSRGANGVIIITTKRGKSLQPTVNASIVQGFSERGIPEYERVNAYEYYPLVWQGIKNNLMYNASPALSEAAASTKASTDVFTNLFYNPFNVPGNQVVGADGKLNPNASLLYDDFDWYDAMARQGKRTDANLSFSGKTEKSDFFVSMGYLNDQGFNIKSDFQRFNARINVNSQIKPWLRTGLNISGSMTTANTANDSFTGSGASFINAFSFTRGIGPIYPVHAFDATGKPIINNLTGEQLYDYGNHPGAIIRPQGASPGRHVVYETMLNEYLTRRNQISARTFVEVKFLKDFTFMPTFSIDLRNNNGDTYWNPIVGDGVTQNGYKSQSNNTIRSYTFNQIVNYNKTIGDHTISALIGHENYDYNYRTFNASRTGLILQGNTEFPNFVTANSSGGQADNDKIESYFSKASYNYKEKYFFDASLRRDGSSRLGSNTRWGNFFSVGGSWSINKDFLTNVNWIDDLRLKASYGQVGNNLLDGYYLDRAFYDLGWNNGSEPGALLASTANPNLKWESQNTFNTGVNFSLFKRRIYGEVEFFKKTVNDLLFSVPQPISDPVTSINQNVGSMYNSGVEILLGADIVRSKDFKWNLVTNWTFLKNKVTKLPAETPTLVSGTKRREVGYDYYQFWLRQYAGVDPKDGAALYIPDPTQTIAAANKRTVNGVEYTINQSNAVFDRSGSAIPDLMGSFTNTFSYKNLSLSVLVNYQIGGKFYDGNYQGLMSTGSYGSALHKDLLGAWTQTNTTSSIPRADFGNSVNINATSTRWLIDASYLAIRNVNLSYSLPQNWLKKIDVSNARLFVTGENLHLFSKRKGLNPSESFDGTNANVYPQARILSVGLNASF